MTKRRLLKKTFLLFILFILSICGCSTVNGNTLENKEATQETENSKSLQWKTQGFVMNDTSFIIDVNEAEPFCEVASGDVVLPKSEISEYSGNMLETWFQNGYYALFERNEGGRNEYILIMDLEGKGVFETVELPELSELGFGNIVCMDVVTRERIALLYMEENNANEMKVLYLLSIDSQGKIISKTDVLAGYKDQELTPEVFVQGSWWSDEAGNSYLLQDNGRSIKVFDMAGEFLLKQEYTSLEETQILQGFHAPEGELIFAVSNTIERKTQLVWLDTQNKRFKVLAELTEAYLRDFSMYENGRLYFIYQNRLWRCNISTGKCEVLFNTLGSSIPLNGSMGKYVTHISVHSDEEIKVIIQGEKGFEYCLLSCAKPETEGMVIKDYIGDSYIRRSVVDYNKTHSENVIQYERETDNEENWTRTMGELVAGKGPDMLFLWSSDERLQTLYDKGVLMEISDMIEPETLEQIFPGILELGTVDDKLVGLCPEGIPIVYWTANSLWEEDWWSQEDVLKIIEENPQLQGLYISGGKQSPAYNLSFMALNHWESSPYVDFEEGVSHFEKKTFAETLEVAKHFGTLPVDDSTEDVQKIKAGECVATLEYVVMPDYFKDMVEKYGEECHMIGRPGQTDYVGYWTSAGVVLVNKKTKYKNEVADFLAYLLCEESQKTTTKNCVREDVIRNSVYYDDYSEEWYYRKDVGSALFTKTQEESYLEDYVDFLQKLGPLEMDSPIADIVKQEATEYFNGSRNAGEIANIIDNRVQLYLDERAQ